MALERIITIFGDESSLSKNLPALLETNHTETPPCQSTYLQHMIPPNSLLAAKSERRPQTNPPKIGFFDLPPEIRLQIYETVTHLNPVLPRQLGPGYPDYHPKPYFTEPVVRPTPANDSDSDWTLIYHTDLNQPSTTTPERNHKPPLLTPHRPRGHIPHALLRTSRRLYKEARCVPFHSNEFVFVSWFSAGTSSALAFVRGLKAWQWAAIRYVRLEIPLGAIDGADKTHLANWGALCERWAFGLRGLRLVVLCGDEANGMGGKRGTAEGLVAVCPCPTRGLDGGEVRVEYSWIDKGLSRLEVLRRLEVELRGSGLSDGQKLDWCEGLRGRMMAGSGGGGGGKDVEIVCVRGIVG